MLNRSLSSFGITTLPSPSTLRTTLCPVKLLICRFLTWFEPLLLVGFFLLPTYSPCFGYFLNLFRRFCIICARSAKKLGVLRSKMRCFCVQRSYIRLLDYLLQFRCLKRILNKGGHRHLQEAVCSPSFYGQGSRFFFLGSVFKMSKGQAWLPVPLASVPQLILAPQSISLLSVLRHQLQCRQMRECTLNPSRLELQSLCR